MGSLVTAAHGVELHALTLTHRGRPAVDGLSGRFAPGRLTAIVGPNGAGKTTLVSAIAGRTVPAAGRIRMASGMRLAHLAQHAEIDRGFPIRVFDAVLLGATARTGFWRSIGRAEQTRAAAALDAVGLAGFDRRPVGELSSGEFQRLLFARLMLQDAELVLLDEPFSAIDARTTAELLDLMRGWRSPSRIVIAVLHDLDQVRAHFDETLLLARRCIAWGPTAAVLTEPHLREAGRAAAIGFGAPPIGAERAAA